MGSLVILAFGAIGFVAWAIARRWAYEAPDRYPPIAISQADQPYSGESR